MKMNFDLSLQQTQKLIMTQQLQMAIKILQMPSVELHEYVQKELVDNPVLELGSDEKPYDGGKVDWKEAVKAYNYDKNEAAYSDEDEDVSPLNFIANTTTLKDYLSLQLNLTVKDKEDRAIGEYLIENIDGSGYLRAETREVAKCFNVTEDIVEGVVKTIQDFDPPGVGARNLKECLVIQLSQRGILTPFIQKIVDEHLVEVGENKYSVIGKELGISPKEAQSIGDLIKGLEPKPGRGFADNDDVKYILPDVIVEKVGSRYIVTVNERATPVLFINAYYRSILENGKDDKALEYVKKKLDRAMWLIKSIEQRKTTIYNVVNSIITFQYDFFEKGLSSLKPLTLKEVAEEVGVHESTVSRAINGKYVQTPKGLFALKYFFARGLDAAQGDNVSSESIKDMIKKFIEGEDPKKPLSDQKITDMLNGDGVGISRRTVAKYREEMGIPSTSKRKRF